MALRIARYGKTRLGALYDGDVLVCVTVDKQGARAATSGSAREAQPATAGSWPRRDQRERPGQPGRRANARATRPG